ncbi:MAG: ABC transporter substrate-binding protein, partial [Firmicutes bacterium]|nr:ABC transporter substrate-binding protein [Bacillota bacterium]
MLQELVEQGLLPPVEERLPLEPFVWEPINQIGKYGGTLRCAVTSPTSPGDSHHGRVAYLFDTDAAVTEIEAQIAKGYEFSDDASVLTIYLREGLKWSDGHPFTSEDIMFWWEDVANNKDLSPVLSSRWRTAEITAPDAYTIKIKFNAPNRPMMGFLAYWGSQQNNFFDPKHHLMQYHIKYNPDANELSKELGYEDWMELFSAYRSIGAGQVNLDLPTINEWVLTERSTTRRIYERNPYYWGVDPAGNQLPYIDRWEVRVFSDGQVAILETLQGGIDYAGFILNPNEFAMYKRYEEEGGFRVLPWKNGDGSMVTYGFNQNHPDPIMREIFQDVRFRRAMSLAIDRDSLNDFVYLGQAEPCQSTVDPTASYFEDWWLTSYAEYDPEAANQLLDEMGLKRGSDGLRRRPDGEPLTILLQVPSAADFGAAGSDEIHELVQSFWYDVGVDVDLRLVAREFYSTRAQAGELDIGAWNSDRTQELRAYIPNITKYNMSSEIAFAVHWQTWYNTQGEDGEEPPAHVKEYFDLLDKWYGAATDEEYEKYAKEVWSFHAENLFLIGTVARPRVPVIVSAKLDNVPERDLPFSDGTSWWRAAKMVQWYYKD